MVWCVPEDVTRACVVRALECKLTTLPNSKKVLGASGSSFAKNTQALCVVVGLEIGRRNRGIGRGGGGRLRERGDGG